MRKQQEIMQSGGLVSMIDVVFQIIIFFVCTASMQDTSRDAQIKLAEAPHGKAETEKNPLQIEIEISSRGNLTVGRSPLSEKELYFVIRKAINESRPQQVPVIIRADARATHNMVRKAMDTCTEAGIMQVKVAAMRERGQ
ncbi:MAG: biopolymer transporter ExbD [Lentisphaerota bacterium]